MSERKLCWDLTVQLTWDDPEIHPDDARDAFIAWFWRSCKDRRKPPHIVLEKPLIATAINGGARAEVVYRNERGERLDVADKDFETRWKRAQKDQHRAPWLDKIDRFILKNWRVIRWPELAEKGCPGLCEWSPRAAVALIRTLPEATGVGGEAWYRQKRLRLGKKGKRRYRVTDFRAYKNGRHEIEID